MKLKNILNSIIYYAPCFAAAIIGWFIIWFVFSIFG